MSSKIKVLAAILDKIFLTSYTQKVIPYGKDGITELSGVVVDNSGDYMKGILTLPISINDLSYAKEFNFDLGIECNSEDILDNAIKELEEYSFNAPNPTYKVITSDDLEDISDDIVDLIYTIYNTYTSLPYTYGFKVYYSSSDNITYTYGASAGGGFTNIMFCGFYLDTYYRKRFAGFFLPNIVHKQKVSISLTLTSKNSIDIGTRKIKVGILLKDFVASPAGSPNMDYLADILADTNGYEEDVIPLENPTISADIELDTRDYSDKSLFLYIMDVSDTYLVDPADYQNDGTLITAMNVSIQYYNFEGKIPYFITIMEKERSLSNDYADAILNIGARYEK